MTAWDPADLPNQNVARQTLRLERLYRLISRCDPWFSAFGLGWLTPLWRVLAGDNPRGQVKEIWRLALVPALSIAAFLMLWAAMAPMVQTSLGAIPGPAQVWEQVGVLRADAAAEAVKAQEFYVNQDAKNAELVAAGKADEVKTRSYSGKQTYPDQILTSIKTVFLGFLIGTMLAVPLGILCGLSPTANAAINPFGSNLQTCLAAGLAAYRHHDRLGHRGRGRAAQKLHRLGGHRDLVFDVADADQHGAWRGFD